MVSPAISKHLFHQGALNREQQVRVGRAYCRAKHHGLFVFDIYMNSPGEGFSYEWTGGGCGMGLLLSAWSSLTSGPRDVNSGTGSRTARFTGHLGFAGIAT